MKKIMALTLVVMALFTTTMTAQAAGASNFRRIPTLQAQERLTFSDMEGHWAKTYAERASELGIMVGQPDGKFGPDKPVTVGEVILVYTRMCKFDQGTIDVTPALRYKDVPDWQAVSVSLFSHMDPEFTGYLEFGEKVYGVNNPATREFVARTLGSGAELYFKAHPEAVPSGDAFTDIGELDNKCKQRIAYLKAVGVTAGLPDGRFNPNGALSRAEFATFAVAYRDKGLSDYYKLPEAPPVVE